MTMATATIMATARTSARGTSRPSLVATSSTPTRRIPLWDQAALALTAWVCRRWILTPPRGGPECSPTRAYFAQELKMAASSAAWDLLQFALAVEVIRLACACLVVAFEEDPQPLAPSICQMRVATSILGLLCRVRCTDRVDLHPACLLDQGAMVDVSDGRCQQRRLWWWKRTTSCQSRQAWYNLQSFSSVDLFLLDYCCSFDSTVVRSW
jgi:hypothetical protein